MRSASSKKLNKREATLLLKAQNLHDRYLAALENGSDQVDLCQSRKVAIQKLTPKALQAMEAYMTSTNSAWIDHFISQ